LLRGCVLVSSMANLIFPESIFGRASHCPFFLFISFSPYYQLLLHSAVFLDCRSISFVLHLSAEQAFDKAFFELSLQFPAVRDGVSSSHFDHSISLLRVNRVPSLQEFVRVLSTAPVVPVARDPVSTFDFCVCLPPLAHGPEALVKSSFTPRVLPPFDTFLVLSWRRSSFDKCSCSHQCRRRFPLSSFC